MFITKNEEIRYIKEILIEVGISQEDAEIVADSLTLANLRGIDSHGILRLPVYVKRLQQGLMETKRDVSIEKEDHASAILNGGNYIAQVTGRIAIKKAIKKTSENTIGLVLVKNSNHFGAAAEYSMMAAEAGMIGIVASNTVPLMPPTGGKEKIIGNNPLSVSFPGGKYGTVAIDMAMSSVAQGKIRNAEINNESVPVGWGVDKDGNNTTNPTDILNEGLLLPVGGPKGYGLALAVEVLTAVLSNSPVSKEVKSIYQFEEKLGISHLFLVINPKSFICERDYNNRIETLLDYIKNCPTAYGVEKIYIPGEIEESCASKRLSEGIFISNDLEKQLKDLADHYGVEPLKDKQ